MGKSDIFIIFYIYINIETWGHFPMKSSINTTIYKFSSLFTGMYRSNHLKNLPNVPIPILV